jgi:tripartite-type tricarboxylate transporter receptor subunit TctC
MTVLGRITVAPPAMHRDVVAQLREAYAMVMRDPAFLTEAEEQGLPISFMPGEEVERMAREILTGDPRIRELVQAVFEN